MANCSKTKSISAQNKSDRHLERAVHSFPLENSTMAATSKREIAIIDQAVDDLETLPSGVRPDVGPILLSKNEPAARQMARAVRGRKGLEAVHIMAHGQPGGLAFSSALPS